MDIEKFSKQVLDTYQQNTRERSRVVYTHANHAERDTGGQVSFTKAANMANKAIDRYEGYRANRLNHEAARDFAAKDTRDRFDRLGNDTQRPAQIERPRARYASAGL